jgi:hypothetical protein
MGGMIHQAYNRQGEFAQYEVSFDTKSIEMATRWIDVAWLLVFASGRSFFARVELRESPSGFAAPPEPVATVGFRYPKEAA